MLKQMHSVLATLNIPHSFAPCQIDYRSFLRGDYKKFTTGIITDGQIRRNNQKNLDLHSMNAGEIMTKNPISINKDTLAEKALSIMNAKKITSLCVHRNKNKKKTIGILHIHNILQSNIY